MNTLWPVISAYIVPIFVAYFFSGVYYIINDVSKPIDEKPSYLLNPVFISLVGVEWLPILIRSVWSAAGHGHSRDFFFWYLRKEAIPQLGVFSLLSVDFYYACSRWL
jgi:hypothetical protein